MSNVIFWIFHQTTNSPENQNILHCLCSSYLPGAMIFQPGVLLSLLRPVTHKQQFHSLVNKIIFLRVLFWRRFCDVDSGGPLSQISVTNLEMDMEKTRTSPSPCYSFSFIRCSVTFLWLINCLSVLLRSPQYLSSILSWSWQLQQKWPFCILEESQISRGTCEGRADSVLVRLRYHRWKTQDTTWMLPVPWKVESSPPPVIFSWNITPSCVSVTNPSSWRFSRNVLIYPVWTGYNWKACRPLRRQFLFSHLCQFLVLTLAMGIVTH